MKPFLCFYLIFILLSCNSVRKEDALVDRKKSPKIEQLKLQLAVIDHAVVLGDYSRALSMASKGLEVAEQLHDNDLIINYRRRLAIINRTVGNFRQSAESFMWLNEYAKETKNEEIQISSSIELGNSYLGLNLIDKALSCYLDAYVMQLHFSENNQQLGLIFQSLGIIFEKIEDYDKAILYYYQSIDASQKTNNFYIETKSMRHLTDCYYKKNELGDVRNLLKQMKKRSISNPSLDLFILYNSAAGDFYVKTKNYDSALLFYRKAESCANLSRDYGKTATIQTRIAHVYTEMEMWNQALIQNKKALDNRLLVGNISHSSSSYANIGMNYFAMGNYTEAEKALLKSLAIAKQMESTVFTSATLNKLLTYYIKTDNHTKAYEYIQTIQHYNDSILKVNQRLNVTLIYKNGVDETDQPADNEVHLSTATYFILVTLIILLSGLSLFLWILKWKNRVNSPGRYLPIGDKTSPEYPAASGILDSLNIGAYIVSESGILVHCNQLFASRLGYASQALAGRSIEEIATNDSPFHDPLSRNVHKSQNKPTRYYASFRTINGTLVMVDKLESSYFLPSGETGKIALILDIPDEKRSMSTETEGNLTNIEQPFLRPSFCYTGTNQIALALKEISASLAQSVADKMGGIDGIVDLKIIDKQINKILKLVEDTKLITLIESGLTLDGVAPVSFSELFEVVSRKIDHQLPLIGNRKIDLRFCDAIHFQVFVDIDLFSSIVWRLCDYYLTESESLSLVVEWNVTSDNQLLVKYMKQVDGLITVPSPADSTVQDFNEMLNSADDNALPVTFYLVKAYVDSMKGRFWFTSDPAGVTDIFITLPCFVDNTNNPGASR